MSQKRVESTPELAESGKRGGNAIFLLPNLVTTAALLCGFSAILSALDAYYGVLTQAEEAPRYTQAAILVFVAMIFDGLDGRVARLTKSESAFGEQYDSLSDLISFGVAPAVIIYLWSLKGLSESSLGVIADFAWFAAYIYLTCAALRLARFNVQIGSVDKRFFIGMPSPTAAAIVVGFVWFGESSGISGHRVEYIALLLTLYSGLMMVTNIKFFSFKDLSLHQEVPFFAWVPIVLGIIAVVVLLIRMPGQLIFFALLAYGISGPIYAFYRWNRRRKLRAERLHKRDE